MQQSFPVFTARLIVAALGALTLAACNDRTDATRPLPQDPSRFITCGDGCGSGGGGGGGSPPPPPPPPVSIASVSLPNNVLPIDGNSVGYTATVTNTGSTFSGAIVQGWIVQGSSRRAAGGLQVDCHAGTGVLPNGTCQVSFTAVASNGTSGNGTLVPGGATLELDLTAGSFTVTRTVGVTLIPGSFLATGSLTLTLSGAAGTVGLVIANNGSQTIGGLSYQATVTQGSAHRSAGATPLSCAGSSAGAGNLPPTNGCTMVMALSVKNTNAGSGTLVPGPATFQVDLLQGTTVLASRSWSGTVVDVRFTSAAVTTSPALIGGIQNFTATVSNAGPAIQDVVLNGYIRQGTAQRGFARATIDCGVGAGVLSSGSCAINGTYSANNVDLGSGTLVPGPATLVVPLQVMFPPAVLDLVEIPITLAPGPTITSIVPPSSVTIGAPGPLVSYTATISNPGPAFTNVFATATLAQNFTHRSAIPGPQTVNCGSGAGNLPVGTCTFTSLFFVNNAGAGEGTLLPDSASLQIQVSDQTNGVLASKSVMVRLVAP